MKSVRSFCYWIAIFGLLGCTKPEDRPSEGGKPDAARLRFVTKSAPIEFSFPAGWYVNPKNNPFDLQCYDPSNRMNTGVFAFKKVELASDSTPTDIFWQQVNDIRSKRKNFQEKEALQKQEDDDKTVTSVTYLGDKDATRNCYRFSLIEFKRDSSRFAVILQIALVGDWEKTKPILEEICQSARPLSDRH